MPETKFEASIYQRPQQCIDKINDYYGIILTGEKTRLKKKLDDVKRFLESKELKMTLLYSVWAAFFNVRSSMDAYEGHEDKELLDECYAMFLSALKRWMDECGIQTTYDYENTKKFIREHFDTMMNEFIDSYVGVVPIDEWNVDKCLPFNDLIKKRPRDEEEEDSTTNTNKKRKV